MTVWNNGRPPKSFMNQKEKIIISKSQTGRRPPLRPLPSLIHNSYTLEVRTSSFGLIIDIFYHVLNMLALVCGHTLSSLDGVWWPQSTRWDPERLHPRQTSVKSIYSEYRVNRDLCNISIVSLTATENIYLKTLWHCLTSTVFFIKFNCFC